MKKSKKFTIVDMKGFTMIELLLCFCILSLCAILFLGVMKILRNMNNDDYHMEDEIALMQLRYILVQSTNITCDHTSLRFQYRGEDWELYTSTNHLVKSSGYQIFMMDIKQGEFEKDQSCIAYSWEREGSNEKNSAIIYCE